MKPWACVPTMALLATASVAALEEEEEAIN